MRKKGLRCSALFLSAMALVGASPGSGLEQGNRGAAAQLSDEKNQRSVAELRPLNNGDVRQLVIGSVIKPAVQTGLDQSVQAYFADGVFIHFVEIYRHLGRCRISGRNLILQCRSGKRVVRFFSDQSGNFYANSGVGQDNVVRISVKRADPALERESVGATQPC
ncbi:hypothetical protein [Sphingomonas morindae]|uniref:Uncharacterized protein n=1 Tax=Sphingomonas morindae TaxID=1541170 RepID=A0ABY4X8G4_9SPHN|nr:hypothetical protein [Sphingomonas morindae]USI72966.1 hypothetical protein LHA26_00350 [Sphingomonas morindae]